MWRNFLTVGLRTLVKNRTYAFITIFGLAIGMAACLMILLFVRYESSYDEWLPGAADIYQVQTWHHPKDAGEPSLAQMTPYVTGGLLAKDFPQIEKQVYALSSAPVFIDGGRASLTETISMSTAISLTSSRCRWCAAIAARSTGSAMC
jgi:putative ABC transport system permease protein